MSTTRTRFEFPEELLDHLGIVEPKQIDLEAIAFYCGAKVHYSHLTTCAARIVGIDDKSIITVNIQDKDDRKRFSIGHELGHWMHDRGTIGLKCDWKKITSDWSGTNKEARANRFSAGLLMPKSMFLPRLGDSRLEFRLLDNLRKDFSTSITATALRAIELTTTPALLIFNRKIRKQTFKRSSGVPFDIYPHTDLRPETFAFNLLFGDEPSMHLARKITADKWLSHPAARMFDLYEHTIKIPDGILTLLSWDDPRFIEALGR